MTMRLNKSIKYRIFLILALGVVSIGGFGHSALSFSGMFGAEEAELSALGLAHKGGDYRIKV